MGSENAQKRQRKRRESASENTLDVRRGRRGRAPADLPEAFAEVLAVYVAALASAPLSEETRRTYASKVRQYLVWPARAAVDGNPLGDADRRDWAVRDYRGYLEGVLKRSPATVQQRAGGGGRLLQSPGAGPARAKRAEVPAAVP